MATEGGWQRRIRFLVELGLRGAAAGSFQWDTSTWDSGAGWSGVEPTFVPLSSTEVAAVTINRGRSSGAERHRTGTATVELVWESPEGHWLVKPESPVRLGQELRLSARVDSSEYLIPLYRGAVRAIEDEWEPYGPYRLRVAMADRLAELAAVDLPERPLEGLGDTTKGRLERIAGLAGINGYYLRLEASTVEHQSSNFARNLLDEAQVTVEGEPGHFYVDREGFVVFRGRNWYLEDNRATTPLLLWTNLLGDPDSVAPIDFSTGENLEDVVNQVSMARAGGTAYTAGPDTDSAVTYGLRTHQRFDLTLRYDADVEHVAEDRLAQLKDRRQYLRALRAHIDPNATTAALEGLLDIELGDLHEVIWDDGSGDEEELWHRWMHVQGVTHRITGTTWEVITALWRYEGVTEPLPDGRWGISAWGEARWG